MDGRPCLSIRNEQKTAETAPSFHTYMYLFLVSLSSVYITAM